jgi:transmembrane sensor
MGVENPMTAEHADARQEAIAWAVHAQAVDFDDWEGFEDWLAADPIHAQLYDRVTIAADEAAQAIARAEAAPRVSKLMGSRTIRRPAPWLGFAIAASLVAMVGVGGSFYRTSRQPALYAVSTRPGERRTTDIDRAAKIELNGDTRVTLDRSNPRVATLDRGEAVFTVIHDPRRPFSVHVGDVTITDIGTVFNVDREPASTLIAVAKGSVRVAMADGEIELVAGQTVTIDSNTGTVTRHMQNAAAVGEWRSGRIDFADMAMGELANRIGRTTGARIAIAPGLADQRVAGSIQLNDDLDRTFQTLGPMLGISIHKRTRGWAWESPRGGNPS